MYLKGSKLLAAFCTGKSGDPVVRNLFSYGLVKLKPDLDLKRLWRRMSGGRAATGSSAERQGWPRARAKEDGTWEKKGGEDVLTYLPSFSFI